MKAPRASKYSNVKTVVDGITFDSKAEAKRWGELLLLERCKLIEDLQRQVSFPIVWNGVKITTYKADFVYVDISKNKRIVEDVKGAKTAVYRIKAKLMAAQGLSITEVKA